MKLTFDYYYKPNSLERIIIAHQQKAVTVIWNQANNERIGFRKFGHTSLIDQRKRLKHQDLLAQSNQEVLRELDSTWRAYYVINSSTKTKVSKPGFRRRPSTVCYLKDTFRYHDDTIRLSIPKFLKKKYGLDYIYIRSERLRGLENIKQVRVHPIKNGLLRIAVIHEVSDAEIKPDNEHYLSIDLGFRRLMCCYTNVDNPFILGKGYAKKLRHFDKLMKKAEDDFKKSRQPEDNRKSSNQMKTLAEKKHNFINDTLHKCTKKVVNFCTANNVHTVVVGELKRLHDKFIQEDSELRYNWPYDKIYRLLEYKLHLEGIRMEKQSEYYTSSVSPLAGRVCAENACKENRMAGLYIDGKHIWNADVVGAYNILRLYLERIGKTHVKLPTDCLSRPRTIKIV